MKKFSEYILESETQEDTEIQFPGGVYISVKPDDITSSKITEYQEKYLKGQEINSNLHCTLIYSKKPQVDDIQAEDYTALGTFQEFNLFGPEQDTLVVEINSQDLTRRNAELTEKYNFISDFDEYKSHITLSYNAKNIDLNSLPAMDFAFTFIDESIEPLDTNWEGKGDSDDDEEGTIVGRALKKIKSDAEKDEKIKESYYHSFKTDDLVSEMPRNNNIEQNMNKKYEWNNRNERFVKLLSSFHGYELYSMLNTYFLTKHKEYIAHVNTSTKDVFYNNKKYKSILINEGNASIKGTYFVLLSNILINTDFDFIFSDKSISKKAIKFYERILIGGNIEPFILINNTVQEPDENINYFNDPSIRIGFSVDKKFIKERIEIAERSLQESEKYSKRYTDMQREQNENNALLNIYGQFEY